MLSGQHQCIGLLVFFLAYADSSIVSFNIFIPINKRHPVRIEDNRYPPITEAKNIIEANTTRMTVATRLILEAKFSIWFIFFD